MFHARSHHRAATLVSLLLFALSSQGCAVFAAEPTATATLPRPTPTAVPSETPTSTPTVTPTPTPTRSFTPSQPLSNSSTYIVQPGDSLYQIALRYGVTLQALEQLNDLPDPNSISVGQAITIPVSPTQAKPAIVTDALTARQGGTLMIQVTRPEMASVTGSINNKTIPFTQAAGYFYALVGISRCAKPGSLPVKLTETNSSGKSTTENMTINVVATAFPEFKVTQIILPPAKSEILNNAALLNREAAQLATVVNKFTPTRLWSGAFRQPMYSYVTENFGTRRSYNGGPVGQCGHEGTDFRGAVGDPVYSDGRGRVAFAALTQVRGNLVVVDHGIGVFSAFFHMSEIAVHEGDMVESGDLIGKVGNLGISTGSHLHWSMWAAGEYVDPMEWTKKVFP